MHFLADRTQNLKPSATLQMAAAAIKRKEQGLPVLNLSIGEPDFPTPLPVCQAAEAAIEEGFTRYTDSGGIRELKEAIQVKLLRDGQGQYELSEITCANGGKQILFNLFFCLLNPRDEVLVSDPAWLSYASQIELAGGTCCLVPCPPETGFTPQADRFAKFINKKTKAIVLNSPSNPTGYVLDQEELEKFYALAEKHDLLLILDDVYEYFYYTENKPLHLLSLKPEAKNRVIMVNSVSKTYAMTGWRLGYAAGPASLIGKMQALQSQSSSNPSSISQKAAIAALLGPQDRVEVMRKHFLGRRDLVMHLLDQQDRIGYVKPEGAFYFMLDIRKLLQAGETDLAFCEWLLNEQGVAVVPGSEFGSQSDGWIRISFASSEEILEEGISRLLKARV